MHHILPPCFRPGPLGREGSGLNHRQASADTERLAGDEIRRRRGQKQHRFGDLFRFRRTAKGRGLGHGIDDFGGLFRLGAYGLQQRRLG